MNLFKLTYIVLLFVSAIVSFSLAYWVRKKGEGKATKWFTYTVVCLGISTLFAMVQVMSPIKDQIYLIQLKFAFGWFSAPAYLLFSIYYTGKSHFLTKNIKRAFIGFYLSLSLLALTNNFHHLFWNRTQISTTFFPHLGIVRTPIYLFTMALIFSCMFVGLPVLLEYGLKAERISKWNLFLLGVSPAPVLITSVVRKYELYPIPASHLDYDAITITFFATVMAYALFRQGFLSFVPFARDIILEKISKPILIIDKKGRIADYNEELIKLYPNIEGKFGENVTDLAPELREESDIKKLANGKENIYSVNTSNIKVDNKISGSAIILDDVTKIREKTKN